MMEHDLSTTNALPTETNEPSLEEKILRARSLYLRGFYPEAAECIKLSSKDERASSSDRLPAYALLARIHFAHGHPSQAKLILEEACLKLHAHLDSFEALQLQIQLDYVKIVGCGEDVSNLDRMQEAYAHIDTKLEQNRVEFEEVDLLADLSRISLVRQMVCQRKGEDIRPVIAARIKNLWPLFKTRPSDALQLLGTLRASEDSKVVISHLQDLLSDTHMDAIYIAPLTFEVARLFGQIGESDTCHEWLMRAEQAYKNCGHKFGGLEVKKLRIYYSVPKNKDTIKALLSITQEYMQLDLPLEVVGTASNLLMTALELADYELFIALQQIFHSVCTMYGIHIERLSLEIQCLAGMNQASTYAGRILEIADSTYQQCINSGYWTFAWLAGHVMVLCLQSLNSWTKAEVLATELADMCIRERLEAQSEAEYFLAFIQYSSRPTDRTAFLNSCQQIIIWLLPTVDTDVALRQWSIACKKLSLIMGIQYETARLGNTDAASAAEATNERLRNVSQHLAEDIREDVEAEADSYITTYRIHVGQASLDNSAELEAIQIYENMAKMYKERNKLAQAAFMHQRQALCYRQIFQKNKLNPNIQYLVEEAKALEIAEQIFHELRLSRYLLRVQHALTRIVFQFWVEGRISADYLGSRLQSFETAASILRQELSAIGGLEALLEKQRFVADSQLIDSYKWGLHFALHPTQPEFLFLWNQAFKAKSLSDMLGLDIVVKDNHGAGKDNQQPEEFHIPNESLSDAAANKERLDGQTTDVLDHDVAQPSAVADFLAINNSEVTDINQVRYLSATDKNLEQERSVIFVDWLVSLERLYCVIVDCESTACSVHVLPKTIAFVKAWILSNFSNDTIRRNCLESDTLDVTRHPLRDLDFLIEPIVERSKERDLVIFSTTSCLSQLPLHALKLPGTVPIPMIARNPILYAPSLRMLQSCLTRSLESENSIGRKTTFLSVYSDNEDEARQIKRRLTQVRSLFNGHILHDEQITKSNFAEVVKDSRIVHFHGHCQNETPNILQQALVLGTVPDQVEQDLENTVSRLKLDTPSVDEPKSGNNPSDLAPASTVANNTVEAIQLISATAQSIKESVSDPAALFLGSNEVDRKTHLTVEEILRLRLNLSPLVALIACGSNVQSIAPGDEPLGLTAGFLCAGAASVIGTMWRVKSGAGRKFTKAFYSELNTGTIGYKDLAVAMQEAILAVRHKDRYNSVYDWGSFCLHGSWMLSL